MDNMTDLDKEQQCGEDVSKMVIGDYHRKLFKNNR